MERWRVRTKVSGRVVWWTVILWDCVWGTYIYSGVSRTYYWRSRLEACMHVMHGVHSHRPHRARATTGDGIDVDRW